MLVLALAFLATPAAAHVAERGLVLLLPTGYYLWGGALAVGASFAALALVRPDGLSRAARARFVLAGPPPAGTPWAAVTSLLAFAVMVLLIAAGLLGSRDPLANPLPLAVWTVFWVGLTLAHAVAGHLWHWLNPWTGPVWFVRTLTGRPAPLRLPAGLGHLPALAFLLAFTWAELIDPAPDDTHRLAMAVAGYWALHFAAMLVFGEADWRSRGECFSIFFRLVSLLAPVGRDATGRLVLTLPGARAMEEAMPPGKVLFLLLALAAVSFDGLDGTFFWLGLIGVNPLEFPGRSAVIVPGTLGLIGMWVLMAGGFYAAIGLGTRLAGIAPLPPAQAEEPPSTGDEAGPGRGGPGRGGPGRGGIVTAAGVLVVSLIPISLAYHFAHYLSLLLVNGQYAVIAASDPFGTGADLLGIGETHVTTSFLSRLETVRILWNAQAAAIVGGHVWAVLMAHALAREVWPDARAAVRGEAPLALLMVGYTVFGLWLLSTPTGA